MRDARGGDDRADVGLGHTGSLELGDGRAHQSLPRLQTLGLTRRRLVYHCHAYDNIVR